MSGPLNGQVVLVTGAGRGIGRATGEVLAARGAKVGVLDIDPATAEATAAAIGETGGEALALSADVADRSQVFAAAEKLKAKFGAPTAVVNDAIWIRYEPIDKVTVETIGRMFDVGLKGVFWGIQALLSLRDPSAPASIINIASPAADLGIANAATYSTIKGGIVALTRQLAVELGPQGVRVNAVAPGSIPTPGARAIVDEAGFAKRREQAPLRRQGLPEEIAMGIAFLIGPDAAFVTGEVLHVDGGISVRSM
jgi:NAD(P)-dependent dehydrogenase (short-subunit alcohol dehydrogenase family)